MAMPRTTHFVRVQPPNYMGPFLKYHGLFSTELDGASGRDY